MDPITLSHTTAAFFRRGREYLLMHRAPNRVVAPGMWSGVGGKLERAELNDPEIACLREILEETGIQAEQIRDLTLRYLLVRRHRDTIRLTYVYFGETDAEPTVTTDEGELHWVPESALLDRPYTKTFAAMMKHYLQTPDPERVVVGVAENDNGACRMVWSAIEDFEAEV